MLFEVKSMGEPNASYLENSIDIDELRESSVGKLPKASNRHRRYKPRRTTSDRLQEAISKMISEHGDILSHQEKPWASITFSGSRHEFLLDFDGPDAVEFGENFIADLPDHEFSIPGQLVADAQISEVNHSFTPHPRLLVTAVLLLLEDA